MTCPPRAFALPHLLLALLFSSGALAHAALIETQQDLPVEVVDAFGKRIAQSIRVTVFVDDSTPAPHPILVINHGRAPDATDRSNFGRARYADISRWFARQGFLVALPTRIGYGVSGGEDVEDSGACTRKNYSPGFVAAAQQTVAVLAAMRARADTVANRSVLLGQSFGGATTVAAAALNPPGVVAAINFAGGAGGNPKTQAGEPCAAGQLTRAFADFGRSARVPMLWAYTDNDQYFGATYPRSWVKAFQDAGGVAEFVQFGPHGDDGHSLFTRFAAVWQPPVAEFLRRHGFAMAATTATP